MKGHSPHTFVAERRCTKRADGNWSGSAAPIDGLTCLVEVERIYELD